VLVIAHLPAAQAGELVVVRSNRIHFTRPHDEPHEYLRGRSDERVSLAEFICDSNLPS